LTLSKKFIDGLPVPLSGKSLHWDDQLRGFGLSITANGTKSFILNYRYKGRERRFTIGRYGDLTPTKARAEALGLKAVIRAGVDPLTEREKGKKEPTFNDLADEYERVHLPRKKWGGDDRRFIAYLRPLLGNRPLSTITRRDVELIFRRKGRAAPIQANRLLSFLSKAFSLARGWGWISDNPARRIERFREEKRDRYVKRHELPQLMGAIEKENNPHIRAFFLLCLLTGARRSEILSMCWEDVDLETGEWRIPDTKSGRAHLVHLNEGALQTIRDLPRMVGNPHVIVGHKKGDRLRNPAKAWARIRERAGLEDVRIHDLRRTVGSYMAQSGASLPLIGAVLNHSNPSTTQIYARMADDSPRAAWDAIGGIVGEAREKSRVKAGVINE
jgi:integrase